MQKFSSGLANYPIPRIDVKKNLETVPTIKYSKIHINAVFQDF